MTLKIVHKNPVSSFNADWLAPLFNQYFSFEPWDPDKTYSKNTLFYLNRSDFCDAQGFADALKLQEQGFRIFVDNLWEVVAGPIPNAHIVSCNRWFWYNESLWYSHLGLDQYQPCRNIQKLALMPMNRSKPHRTEFLQRIQPLLNNMTWSAVELLGQQLPHDGDMTDWNTQRYMRPEWYDTTYLSMVVETIVRPGSKYTPTFITEKTTKPLAFEHPFIVYGNRGTLRELKQWGFETWSHLWDESYDEIVDYALRQDAVINLLSSTQIVDHSLETLQKLQHNRNRFFDKETVCKGIINEIIQPILEYAETNS